MTYRDSVLRTANPMLTPHGQQTMGALGLVGEAGELADEIKKIHFHNKKLDRETILKELGDVRWYLEYLAYAFGFTMDEIEFANMEKLQARYPQGFVDHAEAKR